MEARSAACSGPVRRPAVLRDPRTPCPAASCGSSPGGARPGAAARAQAAAAARRRARGASDPDGARRCANGLAPRPDATPGAAAGPRRAGRWPTGSSRVVPRRPAGAGRRLRACWAWPAGCSATAPAPASCRRCCAALPHNVTTEMDLELWQLADRIRATPRRRGAGSRTGAELVRALPGRHAAAGAAGRAGGVPGTLRAPGRRRDRPGHAALVGGPDAPARRAGQLPAAGRPGRAAPDAQFAAGAATAEAHGRTTLAAAGAGPRPAARRAVGFALAGPGSWSGCGSCRSSPRSSPLAAAAPRSCRRSARSWPPSRIADGPTTSSSWTSHEARAGLRGRGPARAGRAAARASYERELRRRHVPRLLLSDGTEPEALGRAGAAGAEGALRGTPGVGRDGHRQGPGHPRSGRRAAGAGRDPGGALHRPRLDPAVPDRRRRW